MKKGIFILNTDNVNQALINLYEFMNEDNFLLYCYPCREDSLSLHSFENKSVKWISYDELYPLSKFDFLVCGRNCFGSLSAKELIEYPGIIYTDDTVFYEGRAVFGDVVFVNGELNKTNIDAIANFDVHCVGCLKSVKSSVRISNIWDDTEGFDTKVLFIESGHYPFGEKGRTELANAFAKIVLSNPNCKFVVKPRFIIGEAEEARHRNSDYLYYYVKNFFNENWPNNLIWLDKYHSLDTLVAGADVIIHTYSSAHAQAALLGKRIINLIDIPSDETADFRKNRFNLITKIIDKAQNNVSIKNIEKCIENSKTPPKTYVDSIGGQLKNPEFTISEYIKSGNCKNFDCRKKRRLKGYFYYLICELENRFDNYDFFVNKMKEAYCYLDENYLDTDNCLDYIHKTTNLIALNYIDNNWDDICNNPFDRSFSMRVLHQAKLFDLLEKMINDSYLDEQKDSSFYYYSTIYALYRGNLQQAKSNAKLYLGLVDNIKYERLDAEKKEYVDFLKGVLNHEGCCLYPNQTQL